MPLFIRALVELLKNWKSIAALAGLVLSTGFSGKLLLGQATESAKELWWIAALACLVILGREYIRGYFKLKKQQQGRDRQ